MERAPVTHQTRAGHPGARYITNDPQAGTVRLLADDKGIVDITNDAEARAANAFGLAPARKPKAPAIPEPIEETEV